MTPAPATTRTSSAFYVQSALSFGIALLAVIAGELYLPVGPWVRAFLALGTVFLVNSAFCLAKCVRDHQEQGTVLSRLDQARLERLLAEFDPYQPAGVPAHGAPPAPPFPVAS